VYRRSVATMVVAVNLCSIGCGGAETASGGEGLDGPSSAASQAVDATPAPPSIALAGFMHASDGTLLGAAVCFTVFEGSGGGCATSGGDGSFSLQVPEASLLMVTFNKDGYLPTLRAIQTQVSPITLPPGENELWPVANPQTFLGTPVTAGTGQIEFAVLGAGGAPPLAVVAAISSSNQGTWTPTYVGSSTPDAGTLGGFTNLPEGLYVLRFGAPQVTCTADGLSGYPGTAYQNNPGEAVVLVPVVAGTVTAPVEVTCTR
jgi:hypothetical protein